MALPSQHHTDQGYLNTLSLILGRIINVCFSGMTTEQAWVGLFDMLRTWSLSLPARFRPYSRQDRGLSLSLPSIRMLRDCHGRLKIYQKSISEAEVGIASALHYELVCVAILCTGATPDNVATLNTLRNDTQKIGDTRAKVLENCALDLCGVAFTADTPPVLVNSFGPIAFCK